MKEIKGCNAILTGASRGIGISIAKRLALEGVNLALAARSVDALERVRDEVSRIGARAIAIPTDLSNRDSLEELVRKAEQDLGPIDLLINNAAIEASTAAYETLSLDEIETTIVVNLTAPLILTRLLLPGMLSRGRGHIVNISSVEGLLPLPFSEVYSATKHAINGFTFCLRLTSELYKSSVSASAICPGLVGEAGMYQRLVDIYGKEKNVLDYFGTSRPNDVAEAVVRAINRDEPVVTVGKFPAKAVQLLFCAAPRFTGRLARSTGCFTLFRFGAEARGRGRKLGVR